MFQDPYSSLDPRMRVGATIREPLLIQGIGTEREQWARVADLLDEVGLQAASARRYPHEFSGGQRQRVGLARTLSVSPRLLIADEPVSALDVSVQAQVLNLMKSLQEQHDLSLLVISHDLAVVRHLAETIGVLYLGKLVEVGPAEDLYRRPAHHYTKGLIDAIPVPDPTARDGREHAALYGEIPSALAPPPGCRFHTRCAAAQDICKTVEPPLRRFGAAHVAACHFPLQPARRLQLRWPVSPSRRPSAMRQALVLGCRLLRRRMPWRASSESSGALLLPRTSVAAPTLGTSSGQRATAGTDNGSRAC